MNIWGYKNKIRKVKKELKELDEKIKSLQERIHWAERDKRKTIKFEEVSYTLDEAGNFVRGLNRKFDVIISRLRFFERNLRKEREKRKRKK